jgi:hypothetical protein
MKSYRTTPRLVMAAVIVAVHAAGSESAPGFLADLTLEDGTQYLASGAMTARYWPKPGDYLVQADNPDGTPYHYLNPKAVFEEKYEPSEMVSSEPVPPEPLSPEQIAAFIGNNAPASDLVDEQLTPAQVAEFPAAEAAS